MHTVHKTKLFFLYKYSRNDGGRRLVTLFDTYKESVNRTPLKAPPFFLCKMVSKRREILGCNVEKMLLTSFNGSWTTCILISFANTVHITLC